MGSSLEASIALNETVQNDQTNTTTVSYIRPAHKGQVIIILTLEKCPLFWSFLVRLSFRPTKFACLELRAMKLHTRVLNSSLAHWLMGLLPLRRNQKIHRRRSCDPAFLYSAAQHRVHASSRTCNKAPLCLGGRRHSFSVGKWRAVFVCVSSHHTHFVGLGWVGLQRSSIVIFTTSLG